jgi:hypothetical protein
VENENIVSIMVSAKNYREHHVPSPKPTQPKILTPKQIDERREKGICFNCDKKYSEGHKCDDKKLFYIDYEEE